MVGISSPAGHLKNSAVTAIFVQFIYCEAHDVIACKQCYHAEESKVAIILRQEKV